MTRSNFDDSEVISRFNRSLLHLRSNYPIRHSEMALLMLVASHTKLLSPTEISEYFNVSRASITQLLRAMRESGYISRDRTTTDLRGYTVKLTPKGQDLVREASNEFLKTVGRLKSNLGDSDYNHLISLLDKATTILLES